MRETLTPEGHEKLMKARREARGGDLQARRVWIVDGLEHYGKMFMASGDAASSAKLRDTVKEARASLKAEAEALAIAQTPVPDHVSEAARDCAKTLLKTMPGAFLNVDEAADWAKRYLPFSEAVRAHDAATKRARDADKVAIRARRQFAESVEKWAQFATGETTDYKALAVLAATGRALVK